MSKAFTEIVAAKFNSALRRLKAHNATDEYLWLASEPRDSEACERLRVMMSEARYEVHFYMRLHTRCAADDIDRPEELAAIDRHEGMIDWVDERGAKTLQRDPPPKDHGAGPTSARALVGRSRHYRS